jgi:hypothetical protein
MIIVLAAVFVFLIWAAALYEGSIIMRPPKLPKPVPDYERQHALEVELEIRDESGEPIR